MLTLLHDGWTVQAAGGDVPAELSERSIAATVPGCVTTDLVAAGVLPDPYLDENESAFSWIGRTRWRFTTRFDADRPSPGERVDVVCAGLDTVATVELNDVVIGRTANMHRSYRFDVRDALRAGENALSVTFEAPVTYAERASEDLGPRPHVNAHPFNAIRKMACNFGWDWGPDLPTAGIWRPIGLDRWRVARIASVRPLVDVPRGPGTPVRGAAVAPLGRVAVNVSLEGGDDAGVLEVHAQVAGVEASVTVEPGATSAFVELDVPAVELWWPAGYGAQPLYDLAVTLRVPGSQLGGAGRLDEWHGRVGFRTVDLDTSSDGNGRPFTFVVNGIPVMVRGANWIPDDCFVSRIDRNRYAARLQDAVDANMNLLRVWGGGIYESEDFYDVADEIGLLVWQDFLFACAAYAEEDPLRSEVLAEASEAVTRLSVHPSLALWNGCNENLWGHEDWGWKKDLGDRTWGLGYYLEMLPEIVARLDPTRPYSPGSPWSFSADLHPNDPDNGTTHVWDVWNERDYTAYRDYAPRFVSEFGFQGPPAWSTLVRAVHDEPLAVDGPALGSHEKAADGMGKLERGLAAHLPVPVSIEDWHWATSLNQARAVTFGVEHWRSLEPRCAGTIVWQLNDCWPVVSWAAVDGDGRRKPLWYALRRSYAPRLLTIQPRGTGLALVAVNDSNELWSGAVRVVRASLEGATLAEDTLKVDVAPGTTRSSLLPQSLAEPGDVTAEVLVADEGSGRSNRAFWFFVEDKDLSLAPHDLAAEVERVDGGHLVTVTARGLHRDVTLLADKIAPGARVDDMLVTLLDGESTSFHVAVPGEIDADALVAPQVLRSVNQLVAR